jgi:hypothetical protein
MAKGGKVLNFIAWFTGVVVSLAVGFAMADGTIAVPYIGIVNIIVGWVVVITTLLSVILAILKQ